MLKEFSQFNSEQTAPLFTGEMVYSWMFDEYECLKPLKEVANLLALCSDWPKLYNIDVLHDNNVPCVAGIYSNDMYVDITFSEQTANNIRGIKLWITDEYEHDALSKDGEFVLEHLLNILNSNAI